ncbi:hypothetical protein AKJ60_00765 [candidate division MSBL1 archaeon SCGC-AAA385M11]|nr:hypothetical protein AKJ60_00765 [candidate division MSBL1 archaeon SCGC-AAA385M11]
METSPLAVRLRRSLVYVIKFKMAEVFTGYLVVITKLCNIQRIFCNKEDVYEKIAHRDSNF